MTDYFSLPGINFSTLKHLEESPAHAYFAKRNGVGESYAMTVSNAVHHRLLEPHKFDARYAEKPNEQGNAGKELAAKLRKEGKDLIKPEDLEVIAHIEKSVRAHAYASHLLTTAEKEQIIEWVDHETGLLCKAKIDMYDPATGLLVDIKALKDATPYEVSKAIYERHYYAQLAYYERALLSQGKEVKGHMLMICGKASPYVVHLQTFPAGILMYGHAKCSEWLAKWKALEESGEWFGATEARTPQWFIAKMENSYGNSISSFE